MQGNLTTGTIAVGVLAILVGLVGAYAIQATLRGSGDGDVEPTPPEQVLVPLASADLPEGRLIKMGDVQITRMTPSQIENRNLDLSAAMLVPEQIIGRRLRSGVRQGRPFNTTDFYLEGTGPSISELLKPGFRAASVQVPLSRGGAVDPGDYVDLLFRTEPREATETTSAIPETSLTLLQGLEVLDVATPPTRNDGVKRSNDPTITLAMTPKDANILQTVVGHGEISLVKRSPDDIAANASRDDKLTLEDLLGIEPPAPPQGPPRPFVTEIYYRTDRGVNVFPDNGPPQRQPPASAPEEPPTTPPQDDDITIPSVDAPTP